MNGKEQAFFFKRLAYLAQANVSLVESLRIVQEQAGKKQQARMLGLVIADLEEGRTLSKALSKFPNLFGEFSVSILKVGEGSGTLPTTLEYLAQELKKKQLLKSKVVSAFIYPAVVTFATVGIIVFLLLFLFPKITPIFKSLHATLPLTTRVVMGASTFLAHDGFILLAVVLLLSIVVAYFFKRSTGFRRRIDVAVLRLPLVGTMLVSYNVSNFSRMLGLLLKSNVAIEDAARIAADATPNLAYRRQIGSLAAAVARGEGLARYLGQKPKYFPPVFCHMLAVGEKSGTLADTLLYVAEMYDAEVDEYTKNLSTLLEPALMVCMGILVGFIAVSIITPIYGITQSLHT